MSEEYNFMTQHSINALDIKPNMKHGMISKDVNLSLDTNKGEMLIAKQRQKTKEYLEKNEFETYKQDEDEPSTSDIIKENQKLKEARLCLSCRTNNANKLFMPCGHLIACSSCAPLTEIGKQCPLCRSQIMGIVEVHFG
jgi:hypothetical protein